MLQTCWLIHADLYYKWSKFYRTDIVENKDEYTVVIEGGAAKLVQNSNILFAAEIFQKLPSGSKKFVYSDVIVTRMMHTTQKHQ